MEPHHEMRRALDALRASRSLAVESFKRTFPDMYAMSARALMTTPPGRFCHHDRLGGYLTEWSNALGRSPLESLALGCPSDVANELAARMGSAPESTEETGVVAPTPSQHQSDERDCASMAFAGYYATGEGVTLFGAAASSAECARKTFLQQTLEYFHRGVEVEDICDRSSLEVRRKLLLIPQAALDLIASNPPRTTSFYARLHYNLA